MTANGLKRVLVHCIDDEGKYYPNYLPLYLDDEPVTAIRLEKDKVCLLVGDHGNKYIQVYSDLENGESNK